MTSTIDDVITRLSEKGIVPLTEDEGGLRVLRWKTKKSSYELYFDKDKLLKAQIDRFRMCPGPTETGWGWTVQGRGFGGISRFYTFSRWLGTELFTSESFKEAATSKRAYESYVWGTGHYGTRPF